MAASQWTPRAKLTATTPHARPGGNLAPSYRLAEPSRRWRPWARTGANAGEPTGDSMVGFYWEGICWSVARHSASQRKARKSMKTW